MVDKYVKFIQNMSGKRSVWKLWSDFVTMFAIALQIPFVAHLPEARAKECQKIYDSYSEEEIYKFGEMMDLIIADWERSTERDILGEIYMQLRLNSKMNGQYFTPYNIADMLAQMASVAERKLPVVIYEPTCGSGVNLIAYANGLKRQGINYQEDAYFVAQDLDPLVAMMCYIQMSFLGMPGVVIIGDTLKGIHGENEYWYTPFHYINGLGIIARIKAKERNEVKIVSVEKEDEGTVEDEEMSWFYELIGME